MLMFVVAGNRARALNTFVEMRVFLAVAFAVFLWRLGDHTKPIQVSVAGTEPWARKATLDAFRFYRERVRFQVVA